MEYRFGKCVVRCRCAKTSDAYRTPWLDSPADILKGLRHQIDTWRSVHDRFTKLLLQRDDAIVTKLPVAGRRKFRELWPLAYKDGLQVIMRDIYIAAPKVTCHHFLRTWIDCLRTAVGLMVSASSNIKAAYEDESIMGGEILEIIEQTVEIDLNGKPEIRHEKWSQHSRKIRFQTETGETAFWDERHYSHLVEDLWGFMRRINENRDLWIALPEPPVQIQDQRDFGTAMDRVWNWCVSAQEDQAARRRATQLEREEARTQTMRLVLDDKECSVTLDNNSMPIGDPKLHRVFRAICAAGSDGITGAELKLLPGLKSGWPDRVIKKLPSQLFDLISSRPGNSGGYKIRIPCDEIAYASGEQRC